MMAEPLKCMLCLVAVAAAIDRSVAICYRESRQEINSLLHNWTGSGNDATFVCCGGNWDAHNIEWQKGVDVKGTRWCGHWDKLRTHIERNAVYGVRTLLMTYRHLGTPDACIDPVPKDYTFWYAAKWLIFGYFESCAPTPHLFSSQQMRLCGCLVSAHFDISGKVIADTGVNRSGEFQQTGADHFLRYHQGESTPRSLVSFSGKPVNIACRALPSLSKRFTSCDGHSRDIIIQALALLNATLVKTVFSVGDSLHKYRAKEIDIFMFFQTFSSGLLRACDLPIVNNIGAFTFYVKKSSTSPVTAGYALEGSKLSLIFLVLCLAFCFATLVVTDLLDDTTSEIIVANDTMLFLVATFYSTSCDFQTPARFCTSRRFVVLAWVLGSFSLSVYFKGQLTSWLVARIPEPIVDDLIKLEKALDAHTIRPCSTRDTPRSLALFDSEDTGVLSKLLRSLGPETEATTIHDCLKCASNKGRLCFVIRQLPCYMRVAYPTVTESKDPLLLIYAGVPVRKHYRLRMAFRSLVQRIDETDWFHMANMKCEVSQPKERVKPEPETLNLLSVAQFVLPCFGVSVFVLCVEVFFGRCFVLRAARLTRVRVL